MDHPIINPQNPYVGTLRIFPGTLVKVAGRPRPNATRFAINFQTGPSLNPRDDLALHLSPCFTPPRVVRNTLQRGNWGLEEAWGNGSVVTPHQPFEIMVLAEQEQFKIAINGMHYCEFRYRIPYHEITHLTIDGDVDIDRISITSASAPPQAPIYQPTAPPTSTNTPYPPYPTGQGPTGMPMPPMYPNLPGSAPSLPSGPYPTPSAYNVPPVGPQPAASTYMSGYPQTGPSGPGVYPTMPPGPSQGHYPGGPAPAGSSHYGGGAYPQPGHQQQQQGIKTPFGNLPVGGKALGTLAGLGLGAAAGAAVLSAVNPLKPLKKIMKPKKMFKMSHHGLGHHSSSSNSSISSRSSFSSNSS